MVWFSERKKLDKEYKAWIKENYVSDTSFNVISFLADLLDEKKVEFFLNKRERGDR